MLNIDLCAPGHYVVDVTPELADYWMALNTNNRSITMSVVAAYAWDMRTGRWSRDSHQGIAFDWLGRVADGQHRLLAVSESGKTIRMHVTTGLSQEALANIDTGKKRSLTNALELSGRRDLVEGGAVNSNAAIWRVLLTGTTKARMSNQQIFAGMEQHMDAGQFALDEFRQHTRRKSVGTAPVMGAVARAYYHYQHDLPMLRRFVRVLCTGVGTDRIDTTVQAFRTALVERLSGQNSNASKDIYGKTCAAIKAFMEGRIVTKFYCPQDDLFPLPDAGTARPVDRVPGRLGQSGAGGLGVDHMAARLRS